MNYIRNKIFLKGLRLLDLSGVERQQYEETNVKQ